MGSFTGPNLLFRILESKRHAKITVHDLTVANPTLAAIPYPWRELDAALRVGPYEPSPRGLESARRAVAAHLERRGRPVDAADLLLTASTSEAYAYLFKLLCDPGDIVLGPEPSYPLFSYLTALEGVKLAPYPLAFDGTWHIDFAALEEALRPGVRAVLVVSPNNPTGSYLKRDEFLRLSALAETHDFAIIVDEVFADYSTDERPAMERVNHAAGLKSNALVFSLGGLSKSVGLPQLKLGWIACGGSARHDALERLELIADSYLSVGMPVQQAAGRILELGAGIRSAILARVRRNRAALAPLVPAEVSLLPAEGGWSAVLRYPNIRSDEEMACAWLAERNTLVHPGYFFDFDRGSYIVVSLLTEPECFDAGIEAILRP